MAIIDDLIIFIMKTAPSQHLVRSLLVTEIPLLEHHA